MSYYIVSIYMIFTLFIILAPTFYLCKRFAREISPYEIYHFLHLNFFWSSIFEIHVIKLIEIICKIHSIILKDITVLFLFFVLIFFYTTVAILYFYTNICKTTLGVLIFIWKKCDGAKQKYKWFFFSFLDHFINISMCFKTKNNNNGHFPTI